MLESGNKLNRGDKIFLNLERLSVHTMNEEKMNKLLDDIASIKKSTEDVPIIKETVSQMKESLDGLSERVKMLQTENTNLKKKLEQLEIENEILGERLDLLEQHTRKNNLIINGLPLTPREDLREIIGKLGEEVEVEIKNSDICAVHRLPSRSGVPAIVAQLNNRDTKNDLIRAVKKKRPTTNKLGLTNSGNDLPIFCEEQLTQKMKSILIRAKQMRKEGIFQFVWVKDGNIFVREMAESKAYKITEMSQLEGEYTDQEKETRREDKEEASKASESNIERNKEKGTEKGHTTNYITPNSQKRTIEDRSPNQENNGLERTRRRTDLGPNSTNQYRQRGSIQSTLQKFRFNTGNNTYRR